MKKISLFFFIFTSWIFAQQKGLWLQKLPIKNVSRIYQNEEFLAAARRNQVFIYDFQSLQESEVPFFIFDIYLKDSFCVIAGEGGIGLLKKNKFQIVSEINEPIWQIVQADSTLWLVAEKTLFQVKFLADSLKLLRKIPLYRRILGTAWTNKTLWINLEGVGLHILQNNAPIALPYAPKFQKLPFENLLHIGRKKLLFGYDSKIYLLEKKYVKTYSGPLAQKLQQQKLAQVKKSNDKIYVLTQKNTILLIDSTLKILQEFNPKMKVTDIFPFEKHLLLATSKGIFLWKPDVPILNQWITQNQIFNLKFLKNNLYLFSKEGIFIFDNNLNLLQKIKQKNLIFTDGNLYQGKLIFSSNKGLWEYTRKQLKPFLPEIPVLNFIIFSDTFALRLIDKWIFVKKTHNNWKQISPKNPIYYLRQLPNIKTHYPFLFDFATYKEDTFCFLKDKHLFIIHKPLTYSDFPVKKLNQGKWIDYYFSGRIQRTGKKLKDIYFNYSWEIEQTKNSSPRKNYWKQYINILIGLLVGMLLGFLIRKIK